MPVIRLPDGSERSFDHPVTVADVAQSIGAGLARAALAGRTATSQSSPTAIRRACRSSGIPLRTCWRMR
jgi:threonyl-tRNA synthetase